MFSFFFGAYELGRHPEAEAMQTKQNGRWLMMVAFWYLWWARPLHHRHPHCLLNLRRNLRTVIISQLFMAFFRLFETIFCLTRSSPLFSHEDLLRFFLDCCCWFFSCCLCVFLPSAVVVEWWLKRFHGICFLFSLFDEYFPRQNIADIAYWVRQVDCFLA